MRIWLPGKPRRRVALLSLFPFLIYQVKSLKTRLVFASNLAYSQPTTHQIERQFADASGTARDNDPARREENACLCFV